MTCLACGETIPDAASPIIGVRNALTFEFTGEIWHRRCADLAGMERDDAPAE